jgi:glutamine amidotransferase-like uncharacterized protein
MGQLPISAKIGIRVALFGLTLGFVNGESARAEEAPKTKPIRVAIFSDEGVTKKNLPELVRCLPTDEGFQVSLLTADEIHSGSLKDFHVLIHPGGSGSGQAKALGEDGRNRVRKFVSQGGGFIGICAGAYLASAEYPWALKLLDARVIDDEHWARGQGEVQLRILPAGKTTLGADTDVCAIHYENGPLLGPAAKDDIEDFEVLAAFETEIAENGAPDGVMKGTGAIARGKFGKGQVVCFSPHPEKTPGREPLLRAAVREAAKRDATSDAGSNQ